MKTVIYFQEMRDLQRFVDEVVFERIPSSNYAICNYGGVELTSCFHGIDLHLGYRDWCHDDEAIKAICKRKRIKIVNIYSVNMD